MTDPDLSVGSPADRAHQAELDRLDAAREIVRRATAKFTQPPLTEAEVDTIARQVRAAFDGPIQQTDEAVS